MFESLSTLARLLPSPGLLAYDLGTAFTGSILQLANLRTDTANSTGLALSGWTNYRPARRGATPSDGDSSLVAADGWTAPINKFHLRQDPIANPAQSFDGLTEFLGSKRLVQK